MINKPTVGIFSGSASTSLSEEVAKILGLKLGNIDLGKFSDGEIKVEILENVRGHEAYIIQSTCAPTNSNLMELMLITDALKRSSASGDKDMELVTTNSSIEDLEILSIAGPDSTGWVI